MNSFCYSPGLQISSAQFWDVLGPAFHNSMANLQTNMANMQSNLQRQSQQHNQFMNNFQQNLNDNMAKMQKGIEVSTAQMQEKALAAASDPNNMVVKINM